MATSPSSWCGHPAPALIWAWMPGVDLDATSTLSVVDTSTSADPEWSIQQIARLASTTSRTLRHYDDVGLVPPSRIGDNGYRY
jgi:hypothetical protein